MGLRVNRRMRAYAEAEAADHERHHAEIQELRERVIDLESGRVYAELQDRIKVLEGHIRHLTAEIAGPPHLPEDVQIEYDTPTRPDLSDGNGPWTVRT